MKFIELLKDVSWEEIKEALIKNYDDAEKSIDGYFNMYLNLQTLDPVESKMRIKIEWVEPDKFNDKGFWSINGLDGTLQKDTKDFEYFGNVSEEFANSEVTFAIEFTPWNKWLGMTIDNDTLNNISLMKADIVAHCLWEMSFCGFEEEEIQEKSEELHKMAKDLEKMTKEEIEKNTISTEDFIDKLMEKLDKEEDNGI